MTPWPDKTCPACARTLPERPDHFRPRVATNVPGRPMQYVALCRACEQTDRAERRKARALAKADGATLPPVPPVAPRTRFDRVFEACEAEWGPYATWREPQHYALSARLRADAGLDPYPEEHRP